MVTNQLRRLIIYSTNLDVALQRVGGEGGWVEEGHRGVEGHQHIAVQGP